MRLRENTATLLAVLVIVGTVASVTALGIVTAPVVADQHTMEDAKDYTEETNFTVNLPYNSDHYPGDQNAENGSIQYFYAGEDAMREMGAEEGAYIDYIIINADWIDYSACDVENTESFGIDRGNNNSGTKTDEDLVQRHKEATFRDDGITVEFYDWEDLGGDPPYLAPEDAIVASQGEGSAGGPCLTMTSEPGWYQVQGFMNGTEADNGRGEQPSEDAERTGGTAYSNYIYVCECDSEAEAREKLGPPPNEDTGGGGEATPTADGSDGDAEATPTADGGTGDGNEDGTGGGADITPTDDDGGAGSTGDDAANPTQTDEDGDGGSSGTVGGDGREDANRSNPEGDGTPTPGAGPGFGPVAAVLALLAAALLANRRR